MTSQNFSQSQLIAMGQALGVAPEAVLATCVEQGINPADIAPAPRAILKDNTTFKFRVVNATYGVAKQGKNKGRAEVNLQIAPVDGKGSLVKKGTTFLRLALPLDTNTYKFDAKGRERARRDFNTLVSVTAQGKSVAIDKTGLKGPAYEAAVVQENIGYNKLARAMLDSEDGSYLAGIEFFGTTSHSEYQGKTNVWVQNLSANAPLNGLVETSAAKMTEIPGGASEASASGGNDDASF